MWWQIDVELKITGRIAFIAKWYDLWFGSYYDRKNRHLYIMVPVVGFRIDIGKARRDRV